MAKKTKVFCDKCNGACCKYIALPIETPEDRSDYDDIRWYLCHENISVFVEDGDWYLNVLTKCKNLSRDNKCKIYEKRPKICRNYKTDECDLTEGDYDYELHFTSDKQMEEYMKVKFDNNIKNLKPRKKARKK